MGETQVDVLDDEVAQGEVGGVGNPLPNKTSLLWNKI